MTTITNRTTARNFINTLEAFAKRSKYISVRRQYIAFELCSVQVDFTKSNRVVREMLRYIANVLPYEEVEEYDENTTWYKSHSIDQPDGVWETRCCVCYFL